MLGDQFKYVAIALDIVHYAFIDKVELFFLFPFCGVVNTLYI